jgi:4-alpha-glucanotransferase
LAHLPTNRDLLELGAEFRMNTPGTVEGNWVFRLEPGALGSEIAQRLRALTEKHHRL